MRGFSLSSGATPRTDCEKLPRAAATILREGDAGGCLHIIRISLAWSLLSLALAGARAWHLRPVQHAQHPAESLPSPKHRSSCTTPSASCAACLHSGRQVRLRLPAPFLLAARGLVQRANAASAIPIRPRALDGLGSLQLVDAGAHIPHHADGLESSCHRQAAA